MTFTWFISLTQSSAPIIGTIAKLFGVIMNGIYVLFYNNLGIISIGFSIIAFTFIIRLLMIPIYFKQQKSMQEMQRVQPEIKKIQEKYKNMKDPESQKKMQEETAKLYQEHNVNPFGGCLPLLIQMPILFALFAVLRNIPAYIVQVKEVYLSIFTNISAISGYDQLISAFNTSQKVPVKNFLASDGNKVIDLLNSLSSKEWTEFLKVFGEVQDKIAPLYDKVTGMNYFYGINLADVPVDLSQGFSGLMTVGILIPILCVLAQVLVTKTTMPSTEKGKDAKADQTQKTMNTMMPLITLVFVLQMPAGLGLYWLVSNTFQLVQQLVFNKHLKKKNA